MAIAIITPDRNTDALKHRLEELLTDTAVFNEKRIPNPEAIKMAVIWKQEPSALAKFSQLELIHSLGSGVDHIINDPTIPTGIAITRIVDEQLTIGMRRYVCMAVLNHHKNLYFHLRQQKKKSWSGVNSANIPLKIGVMGLGVLGKDIALHLKSLAFEVVGYSRKNKSIAGIPTYSAEKNELTLFLAQVNTLICLLPLTPATRGILNYDLFKQLNPETYLINVGRGAHLVDEDLQRAIDEGMLSGACLDVLNQEPLPSEHPFWSNEKIVLTPHIASITNQESAARQIAENYQRMLEGTTLLNEINRKAGY